MPLKKKIVITVDAEIAVEVKMAAVDWVSDFWAEEASRIEVGEIEDA